MRCNRGFTLVELMIVVTIIAILAAIAIPQYQDYISRTRAAGAISEVSGFRSAVALCIAVNDNASPVGCNAGSSGIPALPETPTRNVIAWISITNGVIRATTAATASSGGANLTIIDTPQTASANMVRWVNTGTVCNPTRGLKVGQGDC